MVLNESSYQSPKSNRKHSDHFACVSKEILPMKRGFLPISFVHDAPDQMQIGKASRFQSRRVRMIAALEKNRIGITVFQTWRLGGMTACG
jgi:hypothetical protein